MTGVQTCALPIPIARARGEGGLERQQSLKLRFQPRVLSPQLADFRGGLRKARPGLPRSAEPLPQLRGAAGEPVAKLTHQAVGAIGDQRAPAGHQRFGLARQGDCGDWASTPFPPRDCDLTLSNTLNVVAASADFSVQVPIRTDQRG